MRSKGVLFFFFFLSSLSFADDLYFGTSVADPYRWLEVAASSQTQTWMASQNQTTQTYFAALKDQPRWQDRLEKATPKEPVSLPKPLEQLVVSSVQVGLVPTPHQWFPSPDGRLVVYSSHPLHTDSGELYLYDVQAKRDRPGERWAWENYGDVAWSADSRGFYYLSISSALNDDQRVAQATVRFHSVGQAVADDALVFPATQEASRYLTPQTSADGKWLFISIADGFSGTRLYARDLTSSAAAFQLVFASTAATASISAWNNAFYLLTNDQVPHFVIKMSTGIGAPWKTFLPPTQDAVWESLQVFGAHVVLTRIRQAASELVICSLTGTDCHTVPLPVGSIEAMEGSPFQDDFYIRFESFFIPPMIYRVSASKAEAVPILKIKNSSASSWITEQKTFKSKDGTVIPLWILHAPHLALDGSHPTVLAGYGGFGVSMTPRYQASVVAWLEAGGIVAIPLLRGGGEFGEAWHAAGSGMQKQHTFDDMIGAADYLIREGYTHADRLAIQGGSNGGLTVAAVITQRPDLFRAAILKNPLTDMVRYPLFGEGPAWISEYGSPKNESDFRALWSYSPYHHVHPGAQYPAVLILSAEDDDRVAPWHARKFAAALQQATRSSHPLLFQTLQHAGHAGSDSDSDDLQEWINRLTFLQHELDF